MSDMKILSELIERIRQDEQLDVNSPEYVGFLNVNPLQDWSADEVLVFKTLFENKRDFLDAALSMRGIEIQKFSDDEAIFEADQDPFGNPEDWQGKSPAKIVASEKFAFWSMVVMVIGMAALLIYAFYTL